MPQSRKVVRRGHKSVSIRTKHKIGGRDSKVSALALSTARLQEMLETGNLRKRDAQTVRNELARRV